MKCCVNCKFFNDELHAEETFCHWWDTAISLPADECSCTKWVCEHDDGKDGKSGMLCNKCGTEVLVEKELDYPYYCPSCDENMYTFETHEKEK